MNYSLPHDAGRAAITSRSAPWLHVHLGRPAETSRSTGARQAEGADRWRTLRHPYSMPVLARPLDATRPHLRSALQHRGTTSGRSSHEASPSRASSGPCEGSTIGSGQRGPSSPTSAPGCSGPAQDWLVLHPAHRSRRVGGRPGHGPAIRTAAPAVALDRLRRRPFRPAQAPHRHPGDHGQSRPDPGAPDRHRRRRSSGTSTSSPSCSAAPPPSMRRCARLSSRNWSAMPTCTMPWRSTRPRSTPPG